MSTSLDRSRVITLHSIYKGNMRIGPRKSRIDLHSGFYRCNPFVNTSSSNQAGCATGIKVRQCWLHSDRQIIGVNTFIVTADHYLTVPIPFMRAPVVRIELDCPVELAFRTDPIAI